MSDGALGDAVAASYLFGDLDASERAEVEALLRPFELAAGEVLFRQGAPADRLYLLTAGQGCAAHDLRRCRSRDGRAGRPVGARGGRSRGSRAASRDRGGARRGGRIRTGGKPLPHPSEARAAGCAPRAPAPRGRALCTRAQSDRRPRRRDAGRPGGGQPAPAAPAVSGRPSRMTALRRCALFAQMADEDLEPLLHQMSERVLRDGETVFAAGEPADALLVVAAGTIEVAAVRSGQPSPARDARPRQGARRPGAHRSGHAQRHMCRPRSERRARAARRHVRRAGQRLLAGAPRRPRAQSARTSSRWSNALRADARGEIAQRGANRRAAAIRGCPMCSTRPRAGASALVELVRSSVIGDDLVLPGPFGPKRIVYADYTASGQVAELHRGLHPA